MGWRLRGDASRLGGKEGGRFSHLVIGFGEMQWKESGSSEKPFGIEYNAEEGSGQLIIDFTNVGRRDQWKASLSSSIQSLHTTEG